MSGDRLLEQQAEKNRKKGCGCALTLALLALVLIGVPVVAYLMFSMRASRLVEAELAAIRAAGEPATADELNDYYECPPAEKDSTKFWLAAVKILDPDDPQYTEDCGELPIVGDIDEEKIIPPPGQAWGDLEAVEEFLAKYADSLGLLHRAAEKGGAARYPVDFSEGLVVMDISHMEGMREANRVLSLQAHVRAHREDARGAAESIHTLFMLAHSLRNEPATIPQLFRMLHFGRACELIRDLLPYVEFSDADLASFRANIQDVDLDSAIERTMIGERALVGSMFRDPESFDDFDVPVISHLGFLGARDDELLLYLKHMNDYVAASRQPWPRRLDDAEALDKEIEALMDSAINRFRYALTREIAGYGANFTKAFARNEATLRSTDAAVAVEQFRRKNGRLPEKLDELVPEFLEKVPLDPFDGQPLRYVVQEDEYKIYSVGENRVDDGGKVADSEYQFQDPDLVVTVKRVEK